MVAKISTARKTTVPVSIGDIPSLFRFLSLRERSLLETYSNSSSSSPKRLDQISSSDDWFLLFIGLLPSIYTVLSFIIVAYIFCEICLSLKIIIQLGKNLSPWVNHIHGCI